MKIDEAVDIINGTTTVKAKYNNHSIFVCFKFLPFDGHCFLALRADVKTWDCVTLVSGAIDEVIPEDLARVMDVVQRLLDTPVKDRFPEKKYRLRWLDSDDPKLDHETYLGRDYPDSGGYNWVTCNKDMAEVFTEHELEKLKDENADYAMIIDAMKEEVKGND